MKSLKNYIYESVEEFRVSDLEVNYMVQPEEIILQAPEVFQESDIQQYMVKIIPKNSLERIILI